MKPTIICLFIIASLASCSDKYTLPENAYEQLIDQMWEVELRDTAKMAAYVCDPASFRKVPLISKVQLLMFKSNGELWLYAGQKKSAMALTRSCRIATWTFSDNKTVVQFSNGETQTWELRMINSSRGLLILSYPAPSFKTLGSYKYEIIEKTPLKTGPGDNYKSLATVEKSTLVYAASEEDGWWRFNYEGSPVYVKKSKMISYEKEIVRSEPPKPYQPSVIKQVTDSITEKIRSTVEPWGKWGVVTLYFLIPVIMIIILIYIPSIKLARIRKVRNWVYLLILYVYAGLFVRFVGTWYLDDLIRKYSDFGTFWIYAIFIVGSLIGIRFIKNRRCSKCRSLSNQVIDSEEETDITTTTTVTAWKDSSGYHTDTRKDTSKATTIHNLRKCDECGYEWWTSFYMPF